MLIDRRVVSIVDGAEARYEEIKQDPEINKWFDELPLGGTDLLIHKGLWCENLGPVVMISTVAAQHKEIKAFLAKHPDDSEALRQQRLLTEDLTKE